jgi:phospholipid N-methyltransferase
MPLPKFIREIIKHPVQLGTVTETSRFAAQTMADALNGASNIVEFGPGTGAVTQHLLNKLPDNGHLTCFEINKHFCDHLRGIGDHRLEVVNGDATDYRKQVRDADCIVSSVPVALFPSPKKERFIAMLGRSRACVQLQYSPFLKRALQRYFRDVRIRFVPLNIPPAFIYICKDPIYNGD